MFYDCEASRIGGLPIEIGWAFVLSSGDIESEGYLVKPPAHWDLDSMWDPDAEALHGISREQLAREGRSSFAIARRMNEVLAGRELFSDAPGDDERWLRIVFEDGGLDPAFTIRRMHADVLIGNLAVKGGRTLAAYEAAKDEISRLAPRTRRAEADARHLAVLWQMVSQRPQQQRP